MVAKRLLCIAPAGSGTLDTLTHALRDWEIHTVPTLGDAGRELRHNRYLVGLLVHVIGSQRHAEIDGFLRKHSDIQWVGVFGPAVLESAPCRDLVTDHLCDYHTAPVDPQRLVHTLGHMHGWAMLRRREPPAASNTATALIGNCASIVRLRNQVERIAKVAAPVLIGGESGSGKELTAQAIHAQSARAGGPFVPINCGAIAPNLIHSELFGYERGAFTGATRDKAGLIESANGGTVFLDEIADLPKELQANLLRFLQEKTICRVGSTRTIPVDARVIAASHVDLQDAVQRGEFREDLFYRLSVLPLTVPALRDRREDLMMLAEHFFRVFQDEKDPRLKGFSSKAAAAILDHSWPGNVRELINRVRRAMVMADGKRIFPKDLGLGEEADGTASVALDDTRQRSEWLAIRACLDRNGQNVSRAARDLGVSRTTLYRLLSKHAVHS